MSEKQKDRQFPRCQISLLFFYLNMKRKLSIDIFDIDGRIAGNNGKIRNILRDDAAGACHGSAADRMRADRFPGSMRIVPTVSGIHRLHLAVDDIAAPGNHEIILHDLTGTENPGILIDDNIAACFDTSGGAYQFAIDHTLFPDG